MVELRERLHGALLRRPWLASAGVVVVGAVVLLWRLGHPDQIVFDEVYYVADARGHLDTGVEPGFAVHPPLGKWFIAAGIALLGDSPVGWRVPGALAGVATLVVTHLLARRLLVGRPDGWWLALLAPVLLLVDGLFLTQSRIAMLDVFLVALSTTALWLLVVDHQRREEGLVRRGRPSLRVAAGVVLGLALAVKWSALLAIGVAGLLTIGWELAAAFRDRLLGGGWRELPHRAAMVLGSLVLVPAAVYVLSWSAWLANYEDTHTAGCVEEDTAACSFTPAERLAGLARHHDAILDFHLGLEASHTYRSDPIGWLLLVRPVVYHWETCTPEQAATEQTFDPETGELTGGCTIPEGTASEVLSIGNPALWWGFVLASPVLVAGTLRRDRRSAVVLVGVLGTWLPWLAVSRTAFLFYLAPAVPLLAVGLVVAAIRLGRTDRRLWTYVGAAGGAATAAGALAVLGLVAPGASSGRAVALAGLVGWLAGALAGAAYDRALEQAHLGGTRAERRPAPPDDRPATAGVAAGPGRPAPAATDDGTTTGDVAGTTGVLVADHPGSRAVEPAREPDPTTSSEPDVLRRTARWGLTIAVVVLATAAWFAPVWFGTPIDADAVRLRWWFDTWI